MQPNDSTVSVAAPAVQPQLRSPWPPLLAASGLGLVSLLFFSPFPIGPLWWQPALASFTLLAIVLPGELDAGDRRSLPFIRRLRAGAIAVGLVLVVLEGTLIALTQLAFAPQDIGSSAEWLFPAWLLLPVLVGLSSALVAQRLPSVRLALGSALLTWPITLVSYGVALYVGGGSEAGSSALFLIIIGGFMGPVLALIGGALGWTVRVLTVSSVARQSV